MCRPVADNIELLILVTFAVLVLLLTQSRELMRQIARTAEEWHRMIDALRTPRRRSTSTTPVARPADVEAPQTGQQEDDLGLDRQ